METKLIISIGSTHLQVFKNEYNNVVIQIIEEEDAENDEIFAEIVLNRFNVQKLINKLTLINPII